MYRIQNNKSCKSSTVVVNVVSRSFDCPHNGSQCSQCCAMLFHCPVTWMDEAESSNRGRGQLYYVSHSAWTLTLRYTPITPDPSASTDRRTDRQTCSLFPRGSPLILPITSFTALSMPPPTSFPRRSRPPNPDRSACG